MDCSMKKSLSIVIHPGGHKLHSVKMEKRSSTHQGGREEAFEANHHLYQFCRAPLGVTNGVASFQRTITDFILEESLEDIFAYLDYITIDQAHLDKNLKRFLAAAKKKNPTYKGEVQILYKGLKILGCFIFEGQIRDPDRLQPLWDLPPLTDLKNQKRVIGFFLLFEMD